MLTGVHAQADVGAAAEREAALTAQQDNLQGQLTSQVAAVMVRMHAMT